MAVKTITKWSTWLMFIGMSNLLIPNAYAGSTLSAGSSHVCGIKTDSTLICWGKNAHNQATPPEGTFTQVSAGDDSNCALRTDGTLACWGRDSYGETSPPPGYYKQVETGNYHACALDENGVPKCWGSNGEGKIDSLPGPFQQLTLGYSHSCGFKADGTAECWGKSSEGQTNIPADTTFSSIVAGGFCTCGIKTDGIAICWGKTTKSYGYLTQIDFNSSLCGLKVDNTVSCPSMDYVPSDVFSYVTVGGWAGFACGLKTEGLVACWGNNNYGQTTPPKGEDGKPIVFKHKVTPIPPLFTEAELKAKLNEARQACQADPASCGIQINPDTELEQAREAGRQTAIASCQANPAACDIVIPADIAAAIGTDLSLHVYKMQYQTLIGTSILWADLIFGGQNEQGELIWILRDYGEVK